MATRYDRCAEYFFERTQVDAVIDPFSDDAAKVIGIVRVVLAGKRARRARDIPSAASLHDVFARLSPREFEVFTLLGGGNTDEEAAARLGLSSRTVRIHRERIMRKLRLDTRGDLMREASLCGAVRLTTRGLVLPGLTCARIA